MIAEAIGLGAPLDYVSNLGMKTIYNYEHYLLDVVWRFCRGYQVAIKWNIKAITRSKGKDECE